MRTKGKRAAQLFSVIISSALILSGCAGISDGILPDVGKLPEAADLMADVEAQEWPAEAESPNELAIAQLNRFSEQLLKQAMQNEGNIMISPASIYLALAMTLQGADGTTAEAMKEVLAGSDVTLEDLNRTARSLMTYWSNDGAGAQLSLANSIWCDQEFIPETSFLQTNADYYAAEARRLDFKDAETIEIINKWVSDATKEKITEIIDEIDPSVIMYLINAVYFKADWAQQFKKTDTYERMFNSPEGEKSVDFMHRLGSILDISADGASGVALPYQDEDYMFFALMPEDASITAENWLQAQPEGTTFASIYEKINTADELQINLALPRFEATYEDSLKDDLSLLGMEIAFAPGEADFSKMQEIGGKEIFIGDVKHKTFIRVDEKGTEAAAVTAVEMRVTSMPMFDKEITFDRPFIYGIMHMPTGVPLFTGVMEDPSLPAD
ncbi:MAG: serine proteinase inhibitor [Clostridiaceae bacterium]|nr:serine proteinase inhibitor [Clostridiaceae bacterium]